MVRILIKIFWFSCSSQNSKLANLNARKPGNTESSKRMSLSTTLGARNERGNQGRSEGGNDYGGTRGFLVRALHLLRLTQCMLQRSPGWLWYSNFHFMNGSITDFGPLSQGSYRHSAGFLYGLVQNQRKIFVSFSLYGGDADAVIILA
jgi:hypothetical protein